MKRFTSEASHQAIQSWATVASTLLAFGALIYSTISYQNTVHMSSRDQARRDWSQMLQMISDNSDLNLNYNVLNVSSTQSAQLDVDGRRYRAYLNRMYFYMNSVVESDGVENWKSPILLELLNHGALQCDLYFPENGAQGLRVSSRYSDDFVKILDDFYKSECPSIMRGRDQMRSEMREAQSVGPN